MPFGPFDSFADCVSKSQDKASPEGFCSWLHHELLGTWPSEASKHSAEALSVFDAQVTAALSEALKSFQFQALITKSVKGVEIFAAGELTDSSGQKRKYTLAELTAMAKSFTPGTVPLKVGHTSQEFNRRVAVTLGVPVEMLEGEQAGKGQMALGFMSQLQVKGDKLLADFEGVPEPLADLIESGQYATVSSEIKTDSQGIPRVTAVALLGAEQPAIESLAGLEAAKIFGKQENALVFSFSHKSNSKQEGTLEKFGKETVIRDMMAQFQEGAGDALTAIAVELGMDPASATLANVLQAIKALKAGPVPEAEVMAQKKEFAAVQETLKQQATLIAGFEKERRVAKYQKLAEGWGSIPGKPEDIGTQLAETEERAGEKVAGMVVAQFAAANAAAERAGVLVGIGRSKPRSVISLASGKLQEFQAAGLKLPQAINKLSKEHPKLFREYQVENLDGGNNNGK